jgi:hypothetical protein
MESIVITREIVYFSKDELLELLGRLNRVIPSSFPFFLKKKPIQFISKTNNLFYCNLSNYQQHVLSLLNNQFELNFWSRVLLTESSTLDNDFQIIFPKKEILLKVPKLIGQYRGIELLPSKTELVLIFIKVAGLLMCFFFFLAWYRNRIYFKKKFFLYFKALLKYIFLRFFKRGKKIISLIEKISDQLAKDLIVRDKKIREGMRILNPYLRCQWRVSRVRDSAQILVKKIKYFRYFLNIFPDQKEIQSFFFHELIADTRILQDLGKDLKCLDKFPVIVDSLEWRETIELMNEIHHFLSNL